MQHDRYEMDILATLKRIANSIEQIERHLNTKNKDLVAVTRCKNCQHYISAENMKNDEMYKKYENALGHDGLCMATDKWTDKMNFCSDGKKKED